MCEYNSTKKHNKEKKYIKNKTKQHTTYNNKHKFYNKNPFIL